MTPRIASTAPKRRPVRAAAVLLAALVAAPPAAAAVHEARLDNGLRILVAPLAGRGEVALAVAYGAGSAAEAEGQEGLAHLVEHLSFHGTDGLGSRDWPREAPLLAEIAALSESSAREALRGEDADFAALADGRRRLAGLVRRQRALAVPQGLRAALEACGVSRHTASTARDFVVFETTLPPDALPCVLAVEARRMDGRSLRGFFDEQPAVLAELTEHARDPAVALVEAAARSAWPGHPYRRGNWGEARSLRLTTPAAADAFYRRLYHPGNAVVALAGDLAAAAAVEEVRTAFAAVTGGPAPPRPTALPAPGAPAGPLTLLGPGNEPWAGVAWRWPPRGSADLPALLVLAEILERRLRAVLVDGPDPRAVAVDVQEWAAGGAAGGLALVRVRARRPADLDPVLHEVDHRLRTLRRRHLAAAEVAAARDRLVRRVERVLAQPRPLARELAVLELQTGHGEGLAELPRTLAAVGAADVRRAARRHLDRSRLIHVRLLPGG